MAYAPILFDDFNDGILDETVRWDETQGPGVSESAGVLNVPCNANYPRVEGQIFQDLSRGIWAVRLTASGTRDTATEFYVGAHDGAGNHISAMGSPDSEYLSFQPGGAVTFSGEFISDVNAGVGVSWNNGDWWGIGNLGSDIVLRMYKSTDGQTWVEMARCTVGGTFNKTHTGLILQAGIWNGTTSTLVAKFDDATFWALDSSGDSYRPVKLRFGSGWVMATPKIRSGSGWVSAHAKPRVDGAWVTST